MTTAFLKHALRIGRRIVLLLTISLGLGIAMLWWVLPDLKTLQPDIEHYLKQEMSLQSLKLGEPSWHWQGHWGLRFANTSLTTIDRSLRITNADLAVYVAISDLLMGHTLPKTIQLQGGSIHLSTSTTEQEMPALPPLQIILDDIDIYWQYGQQHGELKHANLDVDIPNQTIIASAPGLKINGNWHPSGRKRHINIAFDHLNWLPQVWRKPLQGTLSGNISLEKLKSEPWVLQSTFHAPNTAALHFPSADFHFPFDHLSLQMTLTPDSTTLQPTSFKKVSIDKLDWKYKKNSLSATGLWENGLLKIDAQSPYFDMPVMWSFLHPIDTGPWDQWLNLMQHGGAYDSTGGIELDWQTPWQTLPSTQNLSDMRYHMKGIAKDADVFLGMNDAITQTFADVTLDEKGLEAIVHNTILPHNIGQAQGRFYITWSSLLLEVTGKGTQVDAGKLHAWLDDKNAALMAYKNMPAHGDISLTWMLREDLPRSCVLNLKPTTPWSLHPKAIPINVKKGLVTWTLHQGIQLQNMQLTIEQLSGTASLTSKMNKRSGYWELTALDSQLSGKWANLVKKYRMPIEAPKGMLNTSFSYHNKAWHGNIDATQASWKNLLGSTKKKGENFQLEIESAKNNKDSSHPALAHLHLQSNTSLLELQGTATWEASGILLHLDQLTTPAFNGQLNIWSPFNQDPIEMNMEATYLNRAALPVSLPAVSNKQNIPWTLHADIDLFEWGENQIHHANINLTSAENIYGTLQSTAAHVGDFQVQDIDTSFTLMGQGRINLHHISGMLEDQRFNISGTVNPSQPEAITWQGFASLQGNFGQLMQQTELSQRFKDGEMNLFFSGKGVLHHDQAWWTDLDGRLRLNVEDGSILEGGALSKLLAAISLFDLPLLLIGQRADLTSSALMYRKLQMEAILQGKDIDVKKVVLRSSAMDIVGNGTMEMDKKLVDIILVVRPFQNIDAILSVIPLVRNVLGGGDYSFIRKIYRMHGPFTDATVDSVSPKEAGVAAPGLVESILTLPQVLFGGDKKKP